MVVEELLNLIKKIHRYCIARISKGTEKVISVFTVQKLMNESKSLRKVLIFDACEVGLQLTRGPDSTQSNGLFYNYIFGHGFSVLYATNSIQQAREWPEKFHGVFTYFLLEGLKNSFLKVHKDGYVTVYSLIQFISNEMLINDRSLNYQLPTFETKGYGDMMLTTKLYTSPIAVASLEKEIDKGTETINQDKIKQKATTILQNIKKVALDIIEVKQLITQKSKRIDELSQSLETNEKKKLRHAIKILKCSRRK